ncbi:MAG: CAP domain-containing protein [Nitrosopumilaceae archaeon]|nr:CAP domain-containing protein [Nitrosopumilaceae archaeon]
MQKTIPFCGIHINVNPRGQSPTDRGDAFGVQYVEFCGGYYTPGLAENIYYLQGYSAENAAANSREIVDGWMASPGYRDNIMNENYDSIGIGIRFDNSEIYATQVFC